MRYQTPDHERKTRNFLRWDFCDRNNANTPYLKFPVFIYCLMNTVHAATWVLLCHSALRPLNLGENQAKTKYIASLRKNISFTVLFNIAMCALALWFPIIAVSLTALAWLIYLIMGITLSPINA